MKLFVKRPYGMHVKKLRVIHQKMKQLLHDLFGCIHEGFFDISSDDRGYNLLLLRCILFLCCSRSQRHVKYSTGHYGCVAVYSIFGQLRAARYARPAWETIYGSRRERQGKSFTHPWVVWAFEKKAECFSRQVKDFLRWSIAFEVIPVRSPLYSQNKSNTIDSF